MRDVKLKLACIDLDFDIVRKEAGESPDEEKTSSSQWESASQLDASASTALRCASCHASWVRWALVEDDAAAQVMHLCRDIATVGGVQVHTARAAAGAAKHKQHHVGASPPQAGIVWR